MRWFHTAKFALMFLVVMVFNEDSKAMELHPLFSNNMVLQQGMEIPVWGWANPGEKVQVTLGTHTATAETGADGRWEVKFSALAAGVELSLKARSGTNTITVTNILVGEVWLCSGQSNMQWPVSTARNSQKEIAEAAFPKIRGFEFWSEGISVYPQPHVRKGRWLECSPQTVGNMSATAFFFARELYRDLNVPIGFIQCAAGGTYAETWMSPAGFDGYPNLLYLKKQWAEMPAKMKAALVKTGTMMDDWKEKAGKAVETGSAIPSLPAAGGANPVPKVLYDINQPCVLFNSLIAHLAPCAFKGVIWYQGESNAEKAFEYRTLFPALIKDWRSKWNRKFPFLFVQIPNAGGAPVKEPGGDSKSWSDNQGNNWAELREAQAMTLTVPHTAMAVIFDISDPEGIHPSNKQEVGRRLALAAEAVVYGKKMEYSGPLYEKMENEGNSIRLHFTHIGAGLMAQGDGVLKRFAIAGEDKKFAWADAVIAGTSVVVKSANVAKPVAVRYAWEGSPIGANLYNKEGLPASPFRTDDWPGMTQSVKKYSWLTP